MALIDHLPDSCCCGCSLKTSGKIITAFEVAGSILMIVLLIVALQCGTLDDFEDYPQVATYELYITVVTAVVTLIISSMAFHGIATDNRNLIKPWLIFSIIFIITGFLYGITRAIIDIISNQRKSIGGGIVVGDFIWTLIHSYLWMVMLAVYRKMKWNVNRSEVVQTHTLGEDIEHGTPLYDSGKKI